jgi:cytochrome c
MKAKAAEGLVWSPEHIAQMIEKPKDFVPGTKMSFAGLRKEEERADVIAYLATFAEQ